MAVITSPAQVSNISKQMIPKVEAYHQRKLSDKFFCVYLDATYIPLRRITFDREAVYIAIGIKPNGHKEVIDYRIAPSENVENWTEMLQDMKSRGLEQVELFLSDGVVGMKTVLEQTYPKAHFQRCLVHVMRNICAKVRVDDRETIMNEFKQKSINSQIKKLRSKSCTSSMTSGTELIIMSSETSRGLSQICWSFMTILNKSGPQFTPPI
ncbi:Transposase, Mutator family [Lactobacillus kefiranofaciens]|uniref:Mutator family transposase n=1 Tax=Lactobacillus kefiranofaciens TaxID=267818 RepID=A0ABY0M9A6_9LACO|nr:Transposase, Mutator family [Lactobacillus kefiranofaciens]